MTEIPKTQPRNSKLSRHVTYLNAGILTIMLVLIAAVTWFVVVETTRTASARLAYTLSNESIRSFEAHISGDLALLRRKARSEAVGRWFADEENEEKRYAAFNELVSMAASLKSGEFYFAIQDSLNEYTLNTYTDFLVFAPYGRLQPNYAMDAWFFDLLDSGKDYLINIDVDKIEGRWRVWINYIVEYDNRVVGVICTSFHIETLISSMFGQYDEAVIKSYIINNRGYIHVDSADPVRHGNGGGIFTHIRDVNEQLDAFVTDFAQRNERFFTGDTQTEVIRLSGDFYNVAAAAPIPYSDLIVIALYNASELFNAQGLWFFVAILILILFAYMVSLMWVSRHYILRPFEKLINSLTKIDLSKQEIAAVYGTQRGDEIGQLSRTINALMHETHATINREKETVERWLTIYSAAPIGVCFWNDAVDMLDCNEALYKMFELSSPQEYMERARELWADYQPSGLASEDEAAASFERVKQYGYNRDIWLCKDIRGKVFPVDMVQVGTMDKGEFRVTTYVIDLRPFDEYEEKNKDKNRFLARMSHELRTPLSTVLGIAEIQLRNTFLPRAIEEPFARIHESARILLGLVNDILDFSKIESGKLSIIEDEYCIGNLVTDAVNLYTVYLEHKSISLDIIVDENLPVRLLGDILRIKQVVSNLISNAFKYTEAGGVSFSIAGVEKPDDYIELVITIRDTGFGMTAEQLELLKTSEYSRFHEEQERFIEGTGLGIPIVYALVDIMNGNIRFESEVGKGTTVVVGIPQKKCSNAVLGAEAVKNLQNFDLSLKPVDEEAKFIPQPLPYGKVLVVDDIRANLFVAQGLLAFYDLTVETCTSGKEAIEKVEQGMEYDIIFMDQLMPGLDGTNTMRTIKNKGYTRPIVALTANAIAGQAEEYISKGFDEFISKPIQAKRLDDVLNKFIRDKQPPDAQVQTKATGYVANPDDIVEKLRIDFARNHKNTVEKLRSALAVTDWDTALRLAHTLKTLTGLIKESLFEKTAQEVESIIAEKIIPPEEKLVALEKELERVLSNIYLPANLPHLNNEDKNAAMELLEKLEPMVQSGNAECVHLADELKKIPEAAILVRQMEDFDFTLAAESLKTLRGILEG